MYVKIFLVNTSAVFCEGAVWSSVNTTGGHLSHCTFGCALCTRSGSDTQWLEHEVHVDGKIKDYLLMLKLKHIKHWINEMWLIIVTRSTAAIIVSIAIATWIVLHLLSLRSPWVTHVINTLFHCTVANEQLYYGWVAVANTSLYAIMAWSLGKNSLL